MKFRTMIGAGISALALLGTAGGASAAQAPQDFERFAAHDNRSATRIDYQAFDDILGGVVFEVGRSDRMPGRGRTNASQATGTRVNLGSNSRYLYEANRVVFHALTGEHRAAISEYRAELESIPAQIDLTALNRGEQLAFWFNLHNAVVLDELAKAYPVRDVSRLRVQGLPLHDAPIIDLGGQRISLNDIRFNIVGANWDDPRVIYGFFSGAVGGPSILGRAYTGDRVWQQLDANAGEFVNALRGVESASRGFTISPLYQEWRDVYFTSWPQDIHAHLNRFAEGDTADSLSSGEPDFLRYDWLIADLTNGVGGCRGNSGFNVQSWTDELGSRGQTGCDVLPAHAQNFVQVVQERRLNFLRQGRMGSVTIRDTPTDRDGRLISRDGAPVQRVTPEGDAIDDNSSR